jgi:hypothetical protein
MEEIAAEFGRSCVLFDQSDIGSPKRRSHVRFGSLDIEVSEAPQAKTRPARKEQPPPSVISAARDLTSVNSDVQAEECFASACSSQLCWYCLFALEGIDPKRMPTGYMPLRAVYTFDGFFCSWECMRAHSVMQRDLDGIARRAEFISSLQRDLYGCEWRINLAPRRESASCLGGPLDHDEFRSTFDHARNAMPFSTRLLRREAPMTSGIWYRVE